MALGYFLAVAVFPEIAPLRSGGIFVAAACPRRDYITARRPPPAFVGGKACILCSRCSDRMSEPLT